MQNTETATPKTSKRETRRIAKAAKAAEAASITEAAEAAEAVTVASEPAKPAISAARLAKSAAITEAMQYPYASTSDRDTAYLMQYRDACAVDPSTGSDRFSIADCVSLAVPHPLHPKRMRNHRADIALIPSAPAADAACRERAIKAGNIVSCGLEITDDKTGEITIDVNGAPGIYSLTARGVTLADAAIAKADKAAKASTDK